MMEANIVKGYVANSTRAIFHENAKLIARVTAMVNTACNCFANASPVAFATTLESSASLDVSAPAEFPSSSKNATSRLMNASNC